MKLTDAYRTLMQRQCDLRRDLMQERIDTQAVRHRMEASYVADASRVLRTDRVGYTGTSWLKYENCTSLRVYRTRIDDHSATSASNWLARDQS